MDFTINTLHAIFIAYGVMLGAIGNIVYRTQHGLPIKPIWLRVLWGCFALSLYIGILQYKANIQEFEFNLINIFPVIIIGFLSELIAKALPEWFANWKKKMEAGGGDSGKKK